MKYFSLENYPTEKNGKRGKCYAVFAGITLLLVLALGLGICGFVPTQASAATGTSSGGQYTNIAEVRGMWATAPVAAGISYPEYVRTENAKISLQCNQEQVSELSIVYWFLKATGANSVGAFIGSVEVASLEQLGYNNFRTVDTSTDNSQYGIKDAYSKDGYYHFMLYMRRPEFVFHGASSLHLECDYERPTVPLPADPVKEGYTFIGWYYDEELTRPYDNAPIYEDTTLYPKFTINRFTVTYDSTGGDAVASETVDWNTAASAPTPVRTGFNFTGWYTTDGSKYNGTPVTANMHLVAHWQIKTFTVTFMTADNTVYKTLTVDYGTALGKAMEQAQIASYSVKTFAGAPVSKTSVITQDEQVLVTKLTGMEKVGEYIGTHEWVLWTVVGFVAALMITAGVAIAVAVKRGQ